MPTTSQTLTNAPTQDEVVDGLRTSYRSLRASLEQLQAFWEVSPPDGRSDLADKCMQRAQEQLVKLCSLATYVKKHSPHGDAL